MELVIAIIYCLCLLIGGYILGIYHAKQNPIGTLRIDSSDPDGPYLFLELSSNVDFIKNKRYVTLKVDTKSYITQK